MPKCHCVPLVVAAVLFLAGPGTKASNTESFGVDSYIPEKFTDLQWKLDGGFGFSGNRTDQSDPVGSSSRYDRYHSNSESDMRDLMLSSSLIYDHVTIPRFLNASLGISVYGRASSSESFTDYEDTASSSVDRYGKSEGSIYALRISPSVNAGQYLVSDLFVTAATSYDYNYSGYPDDQSYSYDTSISIDSGGWVSTTFSERQSVAESDRKRHVLTAEISAGWGRFYDGHFAATAMNMVGELRNSGLIEREPDYDEMMALTEVIYQYREKHAIDSRWHRIEALDSVITYLHERGIIADPGPYGHLLIQDVWDYFDNKQKRSFGWSVTAGVSLDYSKYKSQSGFDRDRYKFSTRQHPDSAGAIDTVTYYDITEHGSYKRVDISSSPAFVVRARYSKPLNLKWQLDVAAGGKFYFDAYESDDRDGEYDRTDYTDYEDIYCSVSARYIYDMRTFVTLAAAFDTPIRGRIARLIGEEPGLDFELPRKESSWSLKLLAGVTYRISIPTTLTCNLSWRKENTDWIMASRIPSDESSYSLSVGISHWLY